MSEGLNLVTLFGNLGADPELTQTQGGALLKMRLATTEVWFDKEGKKQERTEWHHIKVWGKRAEGLTRILHKGSRIYVKGRLETSSYEKDGKKHYRTDIIGTQVLLGGGPSNNAFVPPPSAAAGIGPADLPF